MLPCRPDQVEESDDDVLDIGTGDPVEDLVWEATIGCEVGENDHLEETLSISSSSASSPSESDSIINVLIASPTPELSSSPSRISCEFLLGGSRSIPGSSSNAKGASEARDAFPIDPISWCP